MTDNTAYGWLCDQVSTIAELYSTNKLKEGPGLMTYALGVREPKIWPTDDKGEACQKMKLVSETQLTELCQLIKGELVKQGENVYCVWSDDLSICPYFIICSAEEKDRIRQPKIPIKTV